MTCELSLQGMARTAETSAINSGTLIGVAAAHESPPWQHGAVVGSPAETFGKPDAALAGALVLALPEAAVHVEKHRAHTRTPQ